MMETSKRLEGIGEYYFSQKLREIDALNKEGKAVINLGIGSPDLPPHPDVIKVLHEESMRPTVHGYQSYKGSPILRKAISEWYAKWYGVMLDSETEILPLIGSKEGIMHICMTYLNNGDTALVPNPGYPTYSSAVKLAGATTIDYELLPENNFYPDLNALKKQVDDKVKIMFVNYPQMPTGQAPDAARFKELVAFAKEKKILIVHDNPYSFILNQNPLSLLSIEGAKDVVIELNSLSKSHNMAGWRIGMLCGSAEKIEQVLRFKSNMDSGMFLPLQFAAAKALQLGKEWFDELNKIYNERRERVFALLDLIDCKYASQQSGLFVWALVPANYKDGYDVSDHFLKEAAVFLTPGGIFGSAGNKYIRISLCATVEKIDEAITRIKKAV